MSIYARFGEPVTVLRYATKADVLKLDPPFNAEARKAVRDQAWIVIRFEDGMERISHVAYLRADEGWKEIKAALTPAPETRPPYTSTRHADEMPESDFYGEG